VNKIFVIAASIFHGLSIFSCVFFFIWSLTGWLFI
jgi:hypothetical protein